MLTLQKNALILIIVACSSLIGCSKETVDSKTVENNTQPTSQAALSDTLVTADGNNLIGTWQVEYIADKPVIDRSPAQLTFSAQNKISGSASCNNIVSSYIIDNTKNAVSFTPAAMTRKMCPEALMEQELRFANSLPKVSYYKVNSGILYLTDNENNQLFKASRIK